VAQGPWNIDPTHPCVPIPVFMRGRIVPLLACIKHQPGELRKTRVVLPAMVLKGAREMPLSAERRPFCSMAFVVIEFVAGVKAGGPVMVAGPFTHNRSLCDTALGYAPRSQVVPAVAPGLLAGGGRKDI